MNEYLLERRRAWRAYACSAAQALVGYDPVGRACKCADRMLAEEEQRFGLDGMPGLEIVTDDDHNKQLED